MSISLTGSGPSIELTGSGSSITLTVTTGGGSSGGVTDHGLLTGLSDDDHTQYHNDARGDARYLQQANDLSDVDDAATARTNLGLGDSATLDVGTGSGDVAAGDAPASAVSTHSADTTSVHGITDTADLATGPASATDSGIALFDGTGGKTLKDSAVTISTDDTLASDSDAKVPTEQAVKAYVDANAGGGGVWTEIASTTLGSGAASVQFTGLDAYKEIEIRWRTRSSSTALSETPMSLRFNGDSGANYNSAYHMRFSGTSGENESAGDTEGWIGELPGSKTNSDRMASGVIQVATDQPAATRKMAHGMFATSKSSTDDPGVGQMSTEWTNTTDAITSLLLFPGAGNFVAGSRFTLLGRT